MAGLESLKENPTALVVVVVVVVGVVGVGVPKENLKPAEDELPSAVGASPAFC